MIRNKLRTSGATILSALLCVLIGLVIGFIVLVALSYVTKSNDYQALVQKYAAGNYTKADYKYILQYLADHNGCQVAADAIANKAKHCRVIFFIVNSFLSVIGYCSLIISCHRSTVSASEDTPDQTDRNCRIDSHATNGLQDSAILAFGPLTGQLLTVHAIVNPRLS